MLYNMLKNTMVINCMNVANAVKKLNSINLYVTRANKMDNAVHLSSKFTFI